MQPNDDTRDGGKLRKMQTGVYATSWAPPAGRGSTIVVGRWTDLSTRDRQYVGEDTVYGCAICHQAVTKFGAVYWLRYYRGHVYMCVVSCASPLCRNHVAREYGMATIPGKEPA